MPDGLAGFLLWIFENIIVPVIKAVQTWWNDNVVPIWKFITQKFKDFLDWVIGLAGSIADYIGGAISTALNWVTQKLRDFSSWVGGLTVGFVDWLNTHIGGFLTWVSTKFLEFVKWLGSITVTIAGYIAGAISTALNWVTQGLRDFVGWLGKIGTNVASWVGTQITNFVAFTVAQLGAIWDGLLATITGWIEGLVKAFFSGLNTGIAEAGHSPLDTEKETKNEILIGLQRYVRSYRSKKNTKR
jgi:hypothetical protein